MQAKRIGERWDNLKEQLSEQGVLTVTARQVPAPSREKEIMPALKQIAQADVPLSILGSALSVAFNLPLFNPHALDEEEHELIDGSHQGHKWVMRDGTLFVHNPFDPVWARPSEILGSHYDQLQGFGLMPLVFEDVEEVGNHDLPSSNEAEQFLAECIERAREIGSSDIHLEPVENAYLLVRVRSDGQLRRLIKVPLQDIDDKGTTWLQAANTLLIQAGADPGAYSSLVDGAFSLTLSNGKAQQLRMTMRPVLIPKRELPLPGFVLRLMGSASLRNLDDLGLGESVTRDLRALTRRSQGLMLVTGPTGSGKTTTLYALLSEIARDTPGRSIQTLEDPVEAHISGVMQTQLNERAGLDYHAGLRSLLRSDPDVILIGEIRDEHSARMAIRAAQTGHLVFATLHTNSSAEVVSRLRDMGVSNALLSSSLIAASAQRIVRRVCEHCAKEVIFEDANGGHWLKTLGHLKGIPLANELIRLANPTGCNRCNEGYAGRVVVPELILIDPHTSDMIEEGVSPRRIDRYADEQMQMLWHSAMQLLGEGVTTPDELMSLLPSPPPETYGQHYSELSILNPPLESEQSKPTDSLRS
ncbi:MAG: Flp pilus assembly complex ATPase component TadA [Candidatus Thiodiazotropha lotti]|nr:Flp pilus assembly complex ATPase component TadA [Candidatus Thiodiazotropha lotti]